MVVAAAEPSGDALGVGHPQLLGVVDAELGQLSTFVLVDAGNDVGLVDVAERRGVRGPARALGQGCELGVGMNRGIDRVTDNILFDEKMGDTVQIGRAHV